MLSSSNVRYFRYAKNRISCIDIFEISIFIFSFKAASNKATETVFASAFYKI